jgi:hypothetical protein
MIAASDDFHRAIDYYPTYAQAYDYLGMLSFQQGKWEDAIKYGSLGAGYAGQPEPSYVSDARKTCARSAVAEAVRNPVREADLMLGKHSMKGCEDSGG